MKTRFLLITVVFSAWLTAETVTKNSTSFSFPTQIGIVVDYSRNVSFISRINHFARNRITIAWSLPVKAKRGSITIYSVTGSVIKTFPLTSNSGEVKWDLCAEKKIASGIFFARLSYGMIEKSIKLAVYR